MTISKSELTEEELNRTLSRRVTLYENREPKYVYGKVINYALKMTSIISKGYNTVINPITFNECIFNNPIEIGSFEMAGQIIFQDCVFNCDVNVEFENVKFIGKCIFSSDLRIVMKSANAEAKISNYCVKGRFELVGNARTLNVENLNQEEQIIEHSLFLRVSAEELFIYNVKAKLIRFHNSSKFEGDVLIRDSVSNELRIGGISVPNQMIVNNCTITECLINDASGDIKGLTFSDCTITNMNYNVAAAKGILLSNGSLKSLKLYDANEKESVINIEKATINHLEFSRVLNNGQITLREIKIPANGVVSIKSSNLGKIDFIYCNFSKAVLEFENSKITDSFFSETEFPKKVLVDGKKNYGQAQLTFGQLATAFQRQGDNIRAIEYSSRELQSHYKTLNWLSRNFFQKFNLWLYSISNNFGRQWVRGIIFSFSVGLLFFCLLLISTGSYTWGIPTYDHDLLPAYLKFMNPLRFYELETIFKNTPQEGVIKLNANSYLADFGGRMFVAYGYYQTIQAFRRFGRK